MCERLFAYWCRKPKRHTCNWPRRKGGRRKWAPKYWNATVGAVVALSSKGTTATQLPKKESAKESSSRKGSMSLLWHVEWVCMYRARQSHQLSSHQNAQLHHRYDWNAAVHALPFGPHCPQTCKKANLNRQYTLNALKEAVVQ